MANAALVPFPITLQIFSSQTLTFSASNPAIATAASALDDRPMRVEARADGSATAHFAAKAEGAPSNHGTAPAPIPSSNLTVPLVPALSYSSSEDECFYDAEEGQL